MKSPLKNIFRLLLAMVGMSGCEEGPPVFPVEQLVGSSPLKSPPLLVTGSTSQRWLASFDKQLYVFDMEGNPVGDPQLIPFTVREFFLTPTGALAVSREGFIPIDRDGIVQAPIEVEPHPEGIYWAFAQGNEGILVVSAALNKELTAHVYQLDGQKTGSPIILTRPTFGTVLTASALQDGSYVMVWEEGRSLYAAKISSDGQLLKDPFEIYAVGKGGALQRGFAQLQDNGSVLVAWQDSTPGPWSVMTLILKPDGTVEDVRRINPQEKKDATRVSLSTGGQGQMVSWISGTHWGAFSVSGQGQVAIQRFDALRPHSLMVAKGSIESFSMAMQEEKVLVMGAVRQASADDKTLGYQVYSGVFSIPSLTIQN